MEPDYRNDNVFLLNSLSTSSFKASSSSNATTRAHFSPEFKTGNLGWFAAASNTRQWIEVDLRRPRLIAEIKLAASKYDSSSRVTAFKLYGGLQRDDLMQLTNMVITGPNTDKRILFSKLLFARFVRLNPIGWNNRIAMRWEFVEANSKS